MTSQRDSTHRLIASPTEIDRTARELTRIRERYLTHGELAPLALRPVIFESWQRCGHLAVSPAQRSAPLAINRESQLLQLREASTPLLRTAGPALHHLTDFLADSGYVIVLGDAEGRLLDIRGDTAIRSRLARIDFVPGGIWSEAAAGTNAIGTALATGHCVQLMAAEHYCDGWQDLTCTAAPIRHPLTGEIVGVLDLTGDYRLIRPFLTGLLSAAALEIQQRLRSLSAPARPRERRQFSLAAVPGSAGLHLGAAALPQPASEPQPTLSQHERRARDAERLAAAAGIISASLDLSVTLGQIAEQTAYVLGLECAAVCLFASDGSVAPAVWSRRDPAQHARRRALDSLICHVEDSALFRERGELVVIDDLRGLPLSLAQAEQLGLGSIALLPLATARGTIGLIAAPRPTVRPWNVDDLRIGMALAAQAATAIENAHLFAALHQHNRYVEALNAVTQFINSLLDPSERLDLVLERIVAIMDLDVGLVLLRGGDERLALAAMSGLACPAAADDESATAQALVRLAAAAIEGGRPLLLCSCKDRPDSQPDDLQLPGFCDLMAVPLAVGSSSLGVLIVGSQLHHGLSDEDLALFSTIAQQLALALHNAQLLRKAREMEALRESDRLKSQFLAAISHDLRSPLTAIRASVESLIDGSRHPRHGQEQQLQNIASQASRLGRLVDQLLDLSQIEAGVLALDRDWTELPALIGDVCARFEELNPCCTIRQAIAPDLPLQYVDPDSMVQVLWNLLENACKYAPPDAPILVNADWAAGEIQVMVADRGPGIPPDAREQIFRHFYRLKRDQQLRTQGSGLGLAICRGIIEAHGGRIWVEDRVGGGAAFCIALPASAVGLIDPDPLGEGQAACVGASRVG